MDLRLKKVRSPGWRGRGGGGHYLLFDQGGYVPLGYSF